MRLTQILGVISLAILTVTIAACIPLFKQTDRPYDAETLKLPTLGNNQLACDLYKQLSTHESGNVFFSPFSVRTSLAMVYEGSNGDTKAEMANRLYLHGSNYDQRIIWANFVQSQNKDVTLDVANGLWYLKGLAVNKGFLEIMQARYQSGFREVDFVKQPDKARKTVNGWVEDKTHNKIQNLLQPGDIGPDTRLVLTNAIYFKGQWEHKFDTSLTSEREFEVRLNEKVRVPMMSGEMTVDYADNDAMQIVKLPYVGKSHSMVLILPKGRMKLPELEARLCEENWKQWLGDCKPTKVEVTLPKLKFGTRYSLKDDLSKLGMPLAFSAAADFSGITTQEKLFINNVIHQANLEVDEKGTTAAAATAVTMSLGSAPGAESIKHFTVDQPAICAIIDNPTGTILFLGRISNPK